MILQQEHFQGMLHRSDMIAVLEDISSLTITFRVVQELKNIRDEDFDIIISKDDYLLGKLNKTIPVEVAEMEKTGRKTLWEDKSVIEYPFADKWIERRISSYTKQDERKEEQDRRASRDQKAIPMDNGRVAKARGSQMNDKLNSIDSSREKHHGHAKLQKLQKKQQNQRSASKWYETDWKNPKMWNQRQHKRPKRKTVPTEYLSRSLQRKNRTTVKSEAKKQK